MEKLKVTDSCIGSGLPVIIWDEAAMSKFILENNLGIVVHSLTEVEEKVKNISENDYNNMVKNVAEFSEKLRTGYYMTSC